MGRISIQDSGSIKWSASEDGATLSAEVDNSVIPEVPVSSVNGRTGDVTGLAEDSSVSTALETKVDKVAGKDLSANDYTTLEKNKLVGIANNATANQTDSYLLNRTNHTGSQAQSTITNLTTDLAAKANASDTVNLTGNQTIAGVKTFSSSPIVPTATTNTQVVNKAQMDAALTGKSNFPTSDLHVPVRSGGGTQSSFPYSTSPIASSFALRATGGVLTGGTAVAADQLVPKAQMDAADALKVDKTATASALYGNNGSGNQTMIPFSSAYPDGSIAQRSSGGTLAVGVPTSGAHATQKSYVDALVPIYGTGNPNGIVSATVGRIYSDTTGANNTHLWIKAVGTGNTGWQIVPKSTTTANITVSATAPTSPVVGDLWVIA